MNFQETRAYDETLLLHRMIEKGACGADIREQAGVVAHYLEECFGSPVAEAFLPILQYIAFDDDTPDAAA